ncbi:hypothetical protein MAA_11699 [Metarhizium robertsii ARSEF 23]|uniref:Uncharacterized protein n=1 Tax=Metarhizium robertsii (strain ARSEF 23 / ATCC MYA-3075) TaxID=655844 RepID=A0A0B2XDA3_METRA|nr:uncharacterized protein MAA_11699 [Metarhizium robertsii ARSEF 23]KHO10695.1 hypothetical protein MAA_11699 [Metarhizium robertsii ARSEF 23]
MKISVPLVTLFIGLVAARPLDVDAPPQELPPVDNLLPRPDETPNFNLEKANREACRQLMQMNGAAEAATKFCGQFQ